MTIKEELYKQCIVFIEDRLQTVQNTIIEIQESLLSETKSSAGDKHETGRAMLQLEREKAGNQLAEILKVRQVLSKIDCHTNAQKVRLGSVVYTTQASYYMAISAGVFQIEKQSFYAISSGTPIGQLLLGKMVGDEAVFREQSFVITEIL